MSGLTTGDRGVSTVVGYVFALGISSLLVIGLLVATGGYVSDQRQSTVREELEVIGEQVAADLAASDRLVRAGGDEIRVSRKFPDEVTGVPYTIEIDPAAGDRVTIQLSTEDPAVVVEVGVRIRTAVAARTVAGGDIVVRYTGTTLEVTND